MMDKVRVESLGRPFWIRLQDHRTHTSFKVYPVPGGLLSYLVRVFTTRQALRDWHGAKSRVACMGRLGNGQACCHTWTRMTFPPKNGRPVTSPELGEIHFYRNGLTTMVVTHEAVHAGIGALRRKGVSFAELDSDQAGRLPYDGPDEQLCRATHHVAAQIVLACRLRGWC